jgi:PAS domain S-box-containing protein
MTAQVKKHQDEIAVAKGELEVLNATLEEKVARRTQEFLASEEKYRILVDNSPDPIVIAQDGALCFMNPAFEQMFGYTLAEMSRSGLRTEDFFHPEDRERAIRTVESLMRNEPAESAEFRGVTSTGETRLFELRGMRIRYMDEPAVELILLDTTEKKELHEQLVQHEKLRALGELASGVAHDFNNILGIILGRAQLLQQGTGDERALRGLRTIERAAMDGGETVRRIQDFARSRTERDFVDIDVKTLLEEVVEITRTRWRDQAEARNVRIGVELDLRPVDNVKGNGSELREVYTNLIFNAVDAMPAGGTIFISSRMDGGDAVVTLRDTGRGMDDSVRARIFDPFFTTKGAKGMGLGMSVAYGIIERHGGRITLESAPGKGAAFTIRLPAAEPEPVSSADERPAAVDMSARILVIDDEGEILALMSDILDAGGYTAETAGSGPEGLAKLADRPFDLLFCDLGMREMSGWEVVSAVRAQDAAIGVVLLTGWGATLSEERVAEYGIDAVLNKPFEMRRILETVADVLATRRERIGETARRG